MKEYRELIESLGLSYDSFKKGKLTEEEWCLLKEKLLKEKAQ